MRKKYQIAPHRKKKIFETIRNMEILAALDSPYILDYINWSVYDDVSAFWYVYDNISFVKDPIELENVQQPIRTLIKGYGDCDCIATLLASILMALGYKDLYWGLTGEVIDNEYINPRHIFVVLKKNGRYVKLDPSSKKNGYDYIDKPANWSIIIIPMKVKREG